MQKIQFLIVLMIVFAAVGCGPKGLQTCYVEGIVTLDGQPLEGAVITFIPVAADGKTAAGGSDATGKYTLTSDGGEPDKGAVEGEYKVTVKKVEITNVPRPGQAPDPTRANDPNYRPPAMDAVQTPITPRDYMLPTNTPLTATVKKGKNDIPLELKSGK